MFLQQFIIDLTIPGKQYSEGGYGINTQVEKSKKMTTVNFMGYDLNKLFWIFVDSWMW